MVSKKYIEGKYYYLAGIIDGEGHFCLSEVKINSKKKGTYIRAYPKISVSNMNKKLILWIQKNFGGYFSENHRIYKGKKIIIYEWIIINQNAINIVEKIKDFLIVKKDEINLILKGSRIFFSDKYGISKHIRYSMKSKNNFKNNFKNKLVLDNPINKLFYEKVTSENNFKNKLILDNPTDKLFYERVT